MLSCGNRKLISLLFGTLLLSGCAMFEGDDDGEGPAPLVDFNETWELDSVWSRSIGNGQGKHYNRLTPTVLDGVIYAGSANGEVAAVSVSDGDELWEVDLDQPLTAAAGAGPNLVLVANEQGEVIALDRNNGSERWRQSVGGEVLASPQSNGEVVIVQTFDGRVLGLSATDGSQIWNYANTVPKLSLRGTSTPLLIEETAVVGLAGGQLVAFDIATGRIRWENRVAVAQGSTEIERLVDVDGRALHSSGTVFAVGYQGRLLAIDLNSGRRIWAQDISSYVDLAEGFGNVYVAGAEGGVTAFFKNGQGVRWEQTVLARRKLSGPATLSSFVAVGDAEGYVHLLSQVDGSVVGREKVDGDGIRAPLQVVGDKLLVFGNSGKLVAYELEER